MTDPMTLEQRAASIADLAGPGAISRGHTRRERVYRQALAMLQQAVAELPRDFVRPEPTAAVTFSCAQHHISRITIEQICNRDNFNTAGFCVLPCPFCAAKAGTYTKDKTP